jgi:hypothetical protein
MWEAVLKAILVIPVPLVTAMLASIVPYLTYRQNGDKNKLELIGTLAKEIEKPEPCAYLVESCVARMHNIRPLPWSFLRLVLPYSNAVEIIQLVSTGRRVLDLFEISVDNGRPYVNYATALSRPVTRWLTMATCFMSGAFFLVIMSITEWDLLKMLSEQSGGQAMYGEAIYKFVQMLFCAVAFCVFTVQGVILKRANKRLAKIQALIAVNYPASYEKNHSDTQQNTTD